MDKELTSYQKKIKSPKWQKKRLQILQRDDFKCRACGDTKSELHVHHIYYNPLNINPWDYSDNLLITLYDKCHTMEHKLD
jgi:5-methylcytosine-specific restriction endonuclease McrA